MRNSSQKGFTLSEALVAIVIFSGVVISTAPIVQSTLKMSTRVTMNAEIEEQLRSTKSVFRTQLRQFVYAGAFSDKYQFEGNSSTISFLSLSREHQDPVHVTFQVLEQNKSSTLNVSLSSMSDNDKRNQSAQLLTPLLDGQFSFYGRPSAQDDAAWFKHWSATTPPRIVAFDATLLSFGGKNKHFRIEAELGAQGPFNCIFDPIRRSCRDGL